MVFFIGFSYTFVADVFVAVFHFEVYGKILNRFHLPAMFAGFFFDFHD